MPKNRMTQKHSIEDLNSLYRDAESVDQEIFAEQRSNLLLVSGEHYNRRMSSFYRRIREAKDLSSEQKLRLTKNHIQRICKIYSNNIISANPGVGFSPKNEKEVHDQKVSKLHHAVWRDAVEKYNIDELIDDWADNYVQIGETIVKLFWDAHAGRVKSYEQKLNKQGQPLFLDPNGQETTDDGSMMGMQFQAAPDKGRPIHEGEFVFEEVFGFNCLRPPEAKDIRKSPWLCIRKMVDRDELIARFRDVDGIEKLAQASQDETFMVFDSGKGGYTNSKNQVLLREFYFRPCTLYPNGYFYFTTKEGTIVEGELPGGIFPIIFRGFDRVQTTPRGRAVVKTLRPYQAEINRAASKMAEHQITLGDDKLLIQNGTKVSAGVSLPGVRTVNYTGMEPKILQGRDGSQYLNYMNAQISEMYQVAMLQEDTEELPAQLDPYVMLFRSARQKKRFQRYIKGFERFLIDLVKTYLKLAKIHMPDDAVVYAIGTNEAINMAEFRSASDLCYEIKVEAQSDDIETKLGKQIVINHALQYVGTQLKPEDIGKLMRQMPYANFDQSFDDLTLDYDNVTNDVLALDRGEAPPVHPYDPHPYFIKRLTARMRQADFKFLPPQAQMNYQQKVALHEKMEAFNQLQIQRAKAGYIPTGGYLVVCDLYMPDPNNPNKTQRARLPYEALVWLIKQLEAQGTALAQIESMNSGVVAEISQHATQRQPQGLPAPGGGDMSAGASASPWSVVA